MALRNVKRAKKTLRVDANDLRDLIENVPAMVFIASPGPSNTFASRSWREYSGLSAEDTEGFGWQRAVHPEDLQRHMEKWQRHTVSAEPFEDETRFRRAADGAYRWFLVRAVPRRDQYGKVLQWYGALVDIHDRKQAEEALRRSEKELRDVIETIPVMAFSARTDGFVEFVNRRYLEYTNLTPESASGSSWQATVHPDDLERTFRKWREALATGEPLENELRHRNIKGEYRWFLVRAMPLRDEHGKVLKWYGILIDIEDRKRAEEELRRSRYYLAEAERLTHTGSWARDPHTGRVRYWSEESFRILGLNPADGIPDEDVSLRLTHPEDRESVIELRARALREKSDFNVDYRIVLPDGTLKHLHVIAHPVLNESGEVAEYLGTAMDITERKRAEEALRDSETRFRTFVDHAGDALFVYDLEKRTVIDVNRQACESLGYSREELIGTAPLAFHEDSYQSEMESVTARAAAGETVSGTHCYRRKDGSTFPVEVHTTLVSHGGRRFLLMVARDITDRLRAEEAIRQSEKQLRDVIEGIPAIASTIRLDGSVEFINKRWQEYTGMSAEESVGPGWQRAGHPQDMGHYLEKRRAALASGDPFEDEARIRSGDGEYRWFLLRGAPLRDERGNILRWYTTAIDIEDRKRAEELRLEERVRERTRIARELHDTLLQSFQGTILHFQAASTLLPTRAAEAKRMLDRAIDLAAQAITEGRDSIQGLRSPEVEIIDLQVAIRTFGESYAADRGEDGFPVFQVELVGVARELDRTFAVEIYRIAIEALRNSFQHSEARHIKVELHYEEKEFRVVIRDDGKGFDSESLSVKGIKGHYGLHGMRERAKLIGSEIAIRSEVGVGTEVQLSAAAIAAYAAMA